MIIEEVYCKKILKCYYCGIRKRGTQNWISFNNETCKAKVVTCTKNHVACVKARVSDHLTQFTITGCSEDKFTGCDQSELTPGGAKLERCQCETNLCNDLKINKFNNFNIINKNEMENNNRKLESNEEGAFIITEHFYNKLDQPLINKYNDNSQHLNAKTIQNGINSSSNSFTLSFTFILILLYGKIYI